MLPSRTMTHPTRGLGSLRYRLLRASSSARPINCRSTSVISPFPSAAVVEKTQLGGRLGVLAAAQPIDLLAEGVEILETAVYRGESHIRDVIDLLEFVHYPLADGLGGDLSIAAEGRSSQDARHGLFHDLGGDRSLLQRTQHAAPELALVECLAGAVVLDHPRHGELGAFESGE